MARVRQFSPEEERRLPALKPSGGTTYVSPPYVVVDMSQGDYAGGNSFDGTGPVDVCTARNRAYLLTQQSPVVYRAVIYQPLPE